MSKLFRLLFVLWVVLAGIFGAPTPCFAEAIVILHPAIELNRPVVRLSDVFGGVPADIDRPIAQAPAPGKQEIYDVNVLMRLAKEYRLDWQPQSISDHVVVKSDCTRITSDMIRDAVIRKIMDNGEGIGKNTSVDVLFDTRQTEVDIPADQTPDFTLDNFQYDPQTRRFRADLNTASASGPASFLISGRITVKRSIPVLAHQLEAGTTLGPDDIVSMLVPEDRINASVITNAKELIGRELRRDTEGDELLHVQDVMQPRFVKRGSIVTMEIQTPFMTITAQGKALQDGVAGDVVRVSNTSSNRVVEGTVTAPGVVTIQSAQRFAEAQ